MIKWMSARGKTQGTFHYTYSVKMKFMILFFKDIDRILWSTIDQMSTIFTFAEVLAVVLSDVIFFLQESNQKYVFYSQDNKVAWILNAYNYIFFHLLFPWWDWQEDCLEIFKNTIPSIRSHYSFYRPQTKFAKVMFSRCLSVHRGGVCPIACWDTHTHPPTQD